MSVTAPPSLASIIEGNTSGAAAGGVTQSPAPSLSVPAAPTQSSQGQTAPQGGAPAQSQVVATPGAVPPGQNQAGSVPGGTPAGDAQGSTTQQQQAALRALLSQRGFAIPDEISSDDQLADMIASQLDAAATIEQSDEFRTFTQRRAEFQRWLESQQAQQTPPAQPAQPVSQQTQQAASVPAEVLLNAVNSGFITFDSATKKWVPQSPHFSGYADAMNAQTSRVQQAKVLLATDPEAFIAQKIQESLSSAKPAGETAELKKALEELRTEIRTSAERAEVSTWIEQNKSKLYQPDGQFTPYAMLYQQFEKAVDALNPNLGPLERHNQVLQRMATAEQAFRSTAPAPAAPPQKQPSFIENAARRTTENRLSQFAGPAANSIQTTVPRGKNGLPSLQGIIDQNIALSAN